MHKPSPNTDNGNRHGFRSEEQGRHHHRRLRRDRPGHAVRFAEEGARVAAWDVNDGGAPALVEELTKAGARARSRR